MLTKRIIPCLDVKSGRVVKGLRFRSIRDAGDPVRLARRYGAEGADEIVFLDITASEERRRTLAKLVRGVASVLDIPFTVGGGVSSIHDARTILLNGADKAGTNTGAVKDPALITSMMETFGRQCVVVAIDAQRNYGPPPTHNTLFHQGTEEFWYEVYIYGGKKPTGIDAIQWARRAADLGAGEILLTSIDADGTRQGYDMTLTAAVSDAVSVPVIASGGCGEPDHMADVLLHTGASAALAASIFHYDDNAIGSVKGHLHRRGVPIRL
ncbi:MAG: imidazole glycerol phosphate synthase subunit HisF [Cenarchaeum sp. SB0665_bin_23]|nr:imidazole glycerol phosphate synthase subunit HisF [Cenarchaeum sp. SB0667_bin_13]MXY37366.1 imidazole glycerol phosphate synthase subunit HisF [Cenarchaeum sp. SB0664_bin_35]MXY60828.1 imidazole glycerol phosphate synthase subunit HisF [Cenarchaeum sp. SB0665_bin_23]MXZ93822.1 imidazole glycerol phosphate synthase subunit HisF [Cenarchaeum sp. SB0666_bin_15]MYB47069.1 imidazole glycerol phosphate synthase subunit HisF [Cenarchaeum sp. SB0662_bin_33]MYC80040.1 imidazole glycerol phosphate s